jgi:hypothetical protein
MRSSLRIIAILFVACLASTISRAQSSVVFGRADADEEGYEVIATNDGGYLSGGQFTDTIGNVQFWVLKVNAKGMVAWDTIYRLGYDRAFLWSIQPDGTGGALLAGYTGIQNSGSESALVLDIDSVGHITKKYDLNYTRADHAHWFARRKTGGYFWAGHTDSESDSTGVMILMRLDDNLDSVWQKTYSYHQNSYEHAHCGTLTSDGGCVLAGHTSNGGINEHTWAVRVDSNGNEIWKKLFRSASGYDDSPYGITMTREGNFAIFGGVQGSGFSKTRLLLVDSNGNIIFDKGYGNSNAYAFDGFQASDGGYVVVGGEQQSQTTSSALVTRTDAKGIAIWSKDFAGVGNAYGYSGFQHNNQFVIIGTTSKPNADMGDFWATYLDTNGNQVAYDTTHASGPKGLRFQMEQKTITFRLSDNPHSDTVRGTIENIGDDTAHFVATIPPPLATGWVIFPTINGKNLSFLGHDTLSIAPHATQEVQLVIFPYAERADTEHYCLIIQDMAEGGGAVEHCTELVVLPEAGVQENAREQLRLWPTPADKFLTLSGASDLMDYRIYNAAGMLVASGMTSPRIDVRSLTPGVYEMVIAGETRQFVIQR